MMEELGKKARSFKTLYKKEFFRMVCLASRVVRCNILSRSLQPTPSQSFVQFCSEPLHRLNECCNESMQQNHHAIQLRTTNAPSTKHLQQHTTTTTTTTTTCNKMPRVFFSIKVATSLLFRVHTCTISYWLFVYPSVVHPIHCIIDSFKYNLSKQYPFSHNLNKKISCVKT